MTVTINWKKGTFSSRFSLYSEGVEIGELINKSFSHNASSSLNKKTYRFETKGFFNQNTNIIDEQTNRKLGTITYNTWKTVAEIDIIGKSKYIWKSNNSWKSTGKIFQNDQKLIEYKGSSNKGEIYIINYSELLVLTGLFISNYYWQTMVAIFAAVFIPIWITMIN